MCQKFYKIGDFMRDYDKEPLIINDYTVYHVFSWSIFTCILGFSLLGYDLITTGTTGKFSAFGIVSLIFVTYSFIRLRISAEQNFSKNPSYFYFSNSLIRYVENIDMKDSIISETKIAPDPSANISSVHFCVVCELENSYGRFHYLSSYELYRYSSIGVHIGKLALYIKHLMLYLIFALPYKIYKLKKSSEPLWLLKRNFVVKFNNRNYFLINAVSTKEYYELLQYFKALNVKIEDRTDFIPQAQNSGYFTDKNEIWSDDFSDTQIPKKNFKWKLRRFFSLD